MASTGKQTYFFFEILSKLQITHYSRFSWHPTEIKVYFIKLAKHFVLCLKGLQLQFRSKVKLKSTWGEKVFTVAACPRAHLRYPSGNLKKVSNFLQEKKAKSLVRAKRCPWTILWQLQILELKAMLQLWSFPNRLGESIFMFLFSLFRGSTCKGLIQCGAIVKVGSQEPTEI